MTPKAVPKTSMRRALEDPNLFGRLLDGDSWAAWRVILIGAMGEPLTANERRLWSKLTGREHEPGERVEELWAVVGRRGGKTRAMSVLAGYLTALVDYSGVLAPGERGRLPFLAQNVRQAAVAFGYASAIFADVPLFSGLVTNQTADTISLATGIDLEIRAASYRGIRGITAVGAIADEVAFWHDSESANADSEILNAVRPALATTGGMLVGISSPHARRGALYDTHRQHYGPNGDPLILVAQGASRTFNPSLPEKVVARALERDAAAASAEYLAQFRTDVEAFVTREVVEACVTVGVRERAPLQEVRYRAFVDPSGGSSDAMTLAIAHTEEQKLVVDAIRERKPPFSPEAVVEEFAATLKAYRIFEVTGDRYAGEWPRERFRAHGISYRVADLTRSELYREMLPRLNSGTAELLDNAVIVNQIVGLERRVARGGRESIDHAPGGHDDLANVIAGALHLVSPAMQMPTAIAGTYSGHAPSARDIRFGAIPNPLCSVGVGR
jgi:hypothetical protein